MKKSTLMIVVIGVFFAFCGALFFITHISTTPLNEIGDKTFLNTTVPGFSLSHYERMSGPIFINAAVAKYSNTMPIYRGVLREGESINKRFNSSQPRQNVTTPEDAPDVAKKVLEPYGGLPADAESNGAFTQYSRVYNYTLGQYVSGKPMSTSISYSQKKVNGLWTISDSNYINVELGENGEVLRIVKEWRNYTYAGDVPIISLDTAIDKLERLELIESDQHPEAGNITIDLISLGYYAKEISRNETILEPLWMFFGSNRTIGGRLGFYVYARKFANFSYTPTTGSISETITFIDTSDTSPIRWSWDFGDGVNSTLQNPVHAYDNIGNYTVSLTVWNDLGSDTIRHSVIILPTIAQDSGSVKHDPVMSSESMARTK